MPIYLELTKEKKEEVDRGIQLVTVGISKRHIGQW